MPDGYNLITDSNTALVVSFVYETAEKLNPDHVVSTYGYICNSNQVAMKWQCFAARKLKCNFLSH